MTDSCGRRSNSARATVSPPIPESNTPSGALFMHRDAHADPAGERADFEIGGEIAQVGRDVGFGTREEMIEDPEHEPVLHLLALEPEVFRVNLLKVVRFLLRLERHHGRYAFPGHERRTCHRPPRGRLAPSRKKERPEECAHGLTPLCIVSAGRIMRAVSARVVSCPASRHVGTMARAITNATCRRAVVPTCVFIAPPTRSIVPAPA